MAFRFNRSCPAPTTPVGAAPTRGAVVLTPYTALFFAANAEVVEQLEGPNGRTAVYLVLNYDLQPDAEVRHAALTLLLQVVLLYRCRVSEPPAARRVSKHTRASAPTRRSCCRRTRI